MYTVYMYIVHICVYVYTAHVCVCVCVCVCVYPDIYPEVGLLDHIAVLFFISFSFLAGCHAH
jgi:hypothetical protein